jgi:hypothetical protein
MTMGAIITKNHLPMITPRRDMIPPVLYIDSQGP